MSKALYFYGESEEAFETAYFIQKFDKFFDLLNVSSFSQGKLKRKVFQQPYRSPNDFRLTFLEEVLQYLKAWEKSVNTRKGPYSKDERKQMMLSDITQNGIKITG